jgi:general transcriptional corepressor TUP1
LVAAGSIDKVVRIWDIQTGQLIGRLIGHTESVYSVVFTPDGNGLVSGSLDCTLKLWNIESLLKSETGNTPLQHSTGSSDAQDEKKDGGKNISSCTRNFVGHKVYFHIIKMLSSDTVQDYVLSAAISHDGQLLVSGSRDRNVHFWDTNSAQVQLILQGHKNSVISVDLSTTGNLLATGSGDTTARLCECSSLNIFNVKLC